MKLFLFYFIFLCYLIFYIFVFYLEIMRKFNFIDSSINDQLIDFKMFFKNIMKTENHLLNIVLGYILKNNGKQIRPIFVFMSADLFGVINEKTRIAAALIELLHTATLVHDDVVDNSQLRRHNFSIKALWKSKLSVLVGDYLLAKGLLLSVEYHSYDILEIVSQAVKDMAEGELLQLENSRKINVSILDYYKVIDKKTASLIVASLKAGAISVSNDKIQIELAEQIGRNIGFAFQIKDDLLDFEGDINLGKPTGNDIQEGKMTLPIIFSLNKVSFIERKKMIRLIKKTNKSKENIIFIKNFVKINGGIDFAKKEMEGFVKKAKDLLISNFGNIVKIKPFLDLIDYIIDRNK